MPADAAQRREAFAHRNDPEQVEALAKALFDLSEIARDLPPDGSGYPSVSLARTLVRMLALQLPQSLYYNREQSNNHSCGAIHDQLHLSNYLYEANGESVQVYKPDRRNSAFDNGNTLWFTRNLPEVWDDPALAAINSRISAASGKRRAPACWSRFSRAWAPRTKAIRLRSSHEPLTGSMLY